MTVIEQTGMPAKRGGLGSARGRVLKSLLHNPLALTGAILLAVVVIIGVIAPLIAPYGPAVVHFDVPFQLPGTVGYLLGTDDLGRDILSRMVVGIRASLEVGVLAVLLSVLIGTPLGLLAGYWRWLDGIISRLTDVTLAFPFLIIAVGLAAINGPSLANAALAIGVAHIPAMIRVVRGETLRIKQRDFVLGAVAMNASGLRIIFRHVLPNCVSGIGRAHV